LGIWCKFILHLTRSLLTFQVGIDWAGIALERASGLRLNDYLQKNVFQPLGIKNMSMLPGKEMRAKLAHMHQRDADGALRTRDHLQRLPLVTDNASEIASTFHSGGAGMFAQPQEYGSK
jgi:CubicO group peptidase (beta-lactamase class C family)